ncbi:MAG: hypothetical protein K6C32_05020 [Bacilli bacterium]|nr:hypothetical protein [Bacilli bacterium]
MQIETYLKKYQPIVYQTFLNSFNAKHLSHAYLISGNPGTPLLEVAKFFAKSILCDDPSPLACNSCITCLRIDDDNYPDFVVIDGAKGKIKKEEVGSIEHQFEKTAFESKGIMIYILHLVENMTTEAVNSILKFLEEPESEIYAFLTTNNESSILPTIISRCQTMHLKQIDRQEVIQNAIELGVDNSDAELLSYFYNDPELIQESLEDDENKDNYFEAKKALEELLDNLKQGDAKGALFYAQTYIVPQIKTLPEARFFFDMLGQVFEDLVNIKHNQQPVLQSYATILYELVNVLPHIEESLIEILKDRNLLNLNVNVSLLLDKLMLYIVEEDK